MGGKSSTATQTVSIPPDVLARYNAVNARAEETAKTPFQEYSGQFVAPLTPTQQAGITNTNQNAGLAQPFYGAATGMTLGASQGVGPLNQRQIGYYQNPYTQAVVNPTLEALQQQQGQERSQLQANAIKSGAYGGDRAGLERANLSRQQGLATAQAIAPLYQQGYNTAVQTAQGQQGVIASDLARQMQGAQQIAGLGTAAQQAALQGAQAQIGAGTLEQQTQQAQATAEYQQFLQKRGYDFQVAQFLANIAEGTGALSGSTTTTTTPSDKRLKDNIEPVGVAFDGQPIYRYDYGDGRTQLGLIAQDVLARGKPGVYQDDNGYLSVDYRDATNDAASMASQGGAVEEPGHYERGGYVGGGIVGDTDLAAILKSQQQSLGPFSQAGLYGGKGAGAGTPGGGAGYVPSANLPVPKLVTATGSPKQPDSGVKNAISMGTQVASAYKFGKDLKNDYNSWQEGRAADAAKAANAAKTANAANPSGAAPAKINPDAPAKGASAVMYEGQPEEGQRYFIPEGARQNLGEAAVQPPADAAPVADAAPTVDPTDFFAYGGLVPRKGHANGEPVVPGEDSDNVTPGVSSADSSDILGDVVKAGTPHNLSLPKPDKPPSEKKDDTGGTIGGLVGGIAGSFFGPIGTMLGSAAGKYIGGQFAEGGAVPDDGNMFAYGGLVPREAHAAGDVVGEEAAPVPPADIPEDFDTRLGKTMSAIKRIESGGDPSALGPATRSGDRAHGLYQVMGANIPSWTEAALGRRMTPDEFLKDEKAQEETAKHRMGLYLKQYDDPRQVASMWFSGRPIDKAGNSSDVTGTTVPRYVSMFDKYYGGAEGGSDADKPSRRATPASYTGEGTDFTDKLSSIGDSLGEKLTSERYLVPGLSALGALLASRAPHRSQAIGEAIMGGVSGYEAMQKQQMEMAKNLIDVVGNRFERQLVNGQVIYRNKLTGDEVSQNQMQSTIYSMFKKAGLSPEQYGITMGGAAPTAGKKAATSAPAIGAPAGGAPAEGAPAPAGTKPAGSQIKPGAVNDPSDMNETQLKRHIETNAAEYGLIDDDDPAKIRAKISDLKKNAADYRTLLKDPAQATELDRQAQVEQARLDGLLTQAAKRQVDINSKLNEQQSTQYGTYVEGIGKRQDIYERAKDNWTRLGDIYSKLKTGRAANFKADLIGWADGFNIPLPDLNEKLANVNDVDAATKIIMREVYDGMARENLVRAPAASAKGLSQTVPGVTMGPGGVYEVVGKNLGELEYVKKRDDAFLDAARGTSPAKWLRDYNNKNKSSLQQDIARGLNMIPMNPNIPRETIDSLYKTYGPHGYKPQGAEAQTKDQQSAPAAPEAGTVQQGYRFKGGNPADQSNWEKVQ